MPSLKFDKSRIKVEGAIYPVDVKKCIFFYVLMGCLLTRFINENGIK